MPCRSKSETPLSVDAARVIYYWKYLGVCILLAAVSSSQEAIGSPEPCGPGISVPSMLCGNFQPAPSIAVCVCSHIRSPRGVSITRRKSYQWVWGFTDEPLRVLEAGRPTWRQYQGPWRSRELIAQCSRACPGIPQGPCIPGSHRQWPCRVIRRAARPELHPVPRLQWNNARHDAELPAIFDRAAREPRKVP